MKNKCLECKKEISSGAKRCRNCNNNGKNNPNYNGASLIRLFCKDCNKELSKNAQYYNTERCKKCACIENGKNFKQKNNPNYIDGASIIQSYCITCNKKLGKLAFYLGNLYCKSCSQKIRFINPSNHPRYRDGITLIEVFCLDCNKKLNKKAMHSGSKRCNKCSNKGVHNPNYIDGRTKLTGFIRNSNEYNIWRVSCILRDKCICQICNRHTKKLNVNHIKPFALIFQKFLNNYPQHSPVSDKETLLELALKYNPFWDLSNGQTLCIPCHKLVTKSQRTKIVLSSTHLLN